MGKKDRNFLNEENHALCQFQHIIRDTAHCLTVFHNVWMQREMLENF